MTAPLQLARIAVSEMDNNVYLLHDGTHGLLIDAADDAPAITALIDQTGVTVTDLVTTHQHWDHVRALEAICELYHPQHWTSAQDAPGIPVPADRMVADGETVSWFGHDLTMFVVRGHTPGGLVVAATIDGVDHLFVGDSLFPGGVGKTNSAADFHQLLADVIEKIFQRYPDSTVVHPGHGADTTLGAERGQLDQWRARGW
ncbi:MBL fold metallo-hydrolase [Corynebacterium choanae]|nr:MBL fold metallo-hydrolase [Corynebacterium choanae]